VYYVLITFWEKIEKWRLLEKEILIFHEIFVEFFSKKVLFCL